MILFLVRVIGPIMLAAWTITVWNGDPFYLLVGAAVSGIVVLCTPARRGEPEEDSPEGR